DVGLALDKTNGTAGSLEKPKIPVARDIDEALDRASAAAVVHEDRRRYFIPVPGVVGVILEMTFDLAGGYIECDGRCGVKIVAGTLITDPWSAVPSAEVSEIGVRVIISRHPNRRATSLPLVTFGPRFASRLSGSRDRVGPPEFLSCVEVKGCDESTNPTFSARCTDHHLAARNQRGKGSVVAGFVIGYDRGPNFFSRLCIQR